MSFDAKVKTRFGMVLFRVVSIGWDADDPDACHVMPLHGPRLESGEWTRPDPIVEALHEATDKWLDAKFGDAMSPPLRTKRRGW